MNLYASGCHGLGVFDKAVRSNAELCVLLDHFENFSEALRQTKVALSRSEKATLEEILELDSMRQVSDPQKSVIVAPF